MDDLDQLFSGVRPRIIARRLRVDDMLADMILDDPGDEPVEGPTACRDLLQHGRAAGILLERALDGVELATDAANPVEELLPLLKNMRHFQLDPIPPESI
jgi:hypothetical protein